MKFFKLGLDIHGVIDRHPDSFVELANNVALKKQGEIHIITGIPYSKEVEDFLLRINHQRKWWTHYFSIETSLLEKGVEFELINGNKYFKTDVWNKEKGLYCADNEIDMHIDDQQEYLKSFTTPSMLYTDPNIPSTTNELYEMVTAPKLG
ncbi:unnamed protein product [marine sediment metagenome]|uniref:Uncharacterized protein n=1 Tax=marine sediment metagenome TaxID=412755 RepID=X0UH43_9ZZZZ